MGVGVSRHYELDELWRALNRMSARVKTLEDEMSELHRLISRETPEQQAECASIAQGIQNDVNSWCEVAAHDD
jgi:hypothetical protein